MSHPTRRKSRMRIAKPPSTPPTMAPILCLLDVVDDVKELVVIVDTVAVLLAEQQQS